MSPFGCGTGRAPRGRPPWWPEEEPWPPRGSPGAGIWPRARRHYLRRAVLFLAMVTALVVGVSALVSAIVGRVVGVGAPAGWGIARPFGGVLAGIAVGALIAARAFRHFAAPVGDLIAALGRVADGDYATRAREYGPAEVRTLVRAFNSMAERLERQDAQRRALLTDISHELRTPLSVLQGQLEGMLDDVYPRDPAHLHVALEETQILTRLVEDLRTLTLSESLELRLERAPTDVAALVGDVLGSFRAQAADAGIALVMEAAPALPLVDLDPERIRQVLHNLLANALRYTPRGGTVRVRCAPADGGVGVTVEDTGRGIPADDLPHVFDRFYKTPESRGTGLGLAIARGLVRAHGGEISAESAPGRGTAIRVTLPGRIGDQAR